MISPSQEAVLWCERSPITPQTLNQALCLCTPQSRHLQDGITSRNGASQVAGAGHTFSDQEEPLHRAQVDQGGQRPRTPTGKSMKRVYSQPVIGPGRSFSPEARGKVASAARRRPGSVLFPQQGGCRLLLHDGHSATHGPGTHRASLKASTRCRPDEARKPFGQIPPRNSRRPRKLSPHPSFSHTHSRWRCDKE